MKKMFALQVAILGIIATSFAQAAIVDHGAYFQDTTSGQYWFKLTETRNRSYNDVSSKFAYQQEFEGWRYASTVEIENLIANFGIPAQGNSCVEGTYCDAVDVAYAEIFEDLIELLGDTEDAWRDEINDAKDVSADGAGKAIGLSGQPLPARNDWIAVTTLQDREWADRITGLPTIDRGDTIWTDVDDLAQNPAAPSSNKGSFLVRETNPAVPFPEPPDPRDGGFVALFDNLAPEDIDLTSNCDWGPGDCYWDDEQWEGYGAEDGGGGYNVTEFGLAVQDDFDAQTYPWVRMTGYGAQFLGLVEIEDAEFQFLPEVLANPTTPWGDSYIPGTYIPFAGPGCMPFCLWTVDSVTLEFISNNIEIDFDPWNAGNTIQPKSTTLITIQISTTPEFDAADVDAATLRVGPGMAEVAALPLQADHDNDGDIDYIFAFRIEETGIGCLDTSIAIAGRTINGDPLAGHDVIVPIECEELILIDVVPFDGANEIRLDDDYVVQVGFETMSTPGDPIDFDALAEINPDTLKFGPAEAPNVIGNPLTGDIDNDQDTDVVYGFNRQDSGIACGDSELNVSGFTHAGLPIIATDTVAPVNCDVSSCHP